VKFAVSLALLVLLLGMPLGCILAASPAMHSCCPRTSANLKCPYDLFDSAKAATVLVTVSLPATRTIEIAPPSPVVMIVSAPLAVEDGSDLHMLNRILRI
jgi:hypothetical protein